MPRPGSSAQARGPFYGVFGAYFFVSKEDVGLSFVEDRMLLKRRNPKETVDALCFQVYNPDQGVRGELRHGQIKSPQFTGCK